MTDRVIDTHALTKVFGAKTAVAGLSLSVQRGEVFGFLGPNGAGKTTSLRMLLGLARPTSGSGSVLGAPLGERTIRARIGFLPEHFRFHEWLPGRELLRFHGRLLGMSGARLESRIDTLLERVDLLDAAERPLRTYSKGMLQRAGLAQAMLNEPALIFLDEPTSGLDPIGRLLVRDVIADLKRQGTAVFLNSHLLGEVEVTCDRVAFVKQGRIVRETTLASETRELEIIVRIETITPAIVAGLAQFGRDVAPSAVPQHAMAQHGGALRMTVRDEEALPEIARWLVAQNARLYEIHAQRQSLEAQFLEVMGEEQRPG